MELLGPTRPSRPFPGRWTPFQNMKQFLPCASHCNADTISLSSATSEKQDGSRRQRGDVTASGDGGSSGYQAGSSCITSSLQSGSSGDWRSTRPLVFSPGRRSQLTRQQLNWMQALARSATLTPPSLREASTLYVSSSELFEPRRVERVEESTHEQLSNVEIVAQSSHGEPRNEGSATQSTHETRNVENVAQSQNNEPSNVENATQSTHETRNVENVAYSQHNEQRIVENASQSTHETRNMESFANTTHDQTRNVVNVTPSTYEQTRNAVIATNAIHEQSQITESVTNATHEDTRNVENGTHEQTATSDCNRRSRCHIAEPECFCNPTQISYSQTRAFTIQHNTGDSGQHDGFQNAAASTLQQRTCVYFSPQDVRSENTVFNLDQHFSVMQNQEAQTSSIIIDPSNAACANVEQQNINDSDVASIRDDLEKVPDDLDEILSQHNASVFGHSESTHEVLDATLSRFFWSNSPQPQNALLTQRESSNQVLHHSSIWHEMNISEMCPNESFLNRSSLHNSTFTSQNNNTNNRAESVNSPQHVGTEGITGDVTNQTVQRVDIAQSFVTSQESVGENVVLDYHENFAEGPSTVNRSGQNNGNDSTLSNNGNDSTLSNTNSSNTNNITTTDNINVNNATMSDSNTLPTASNTGGNSISIPDTTTGFSVANSGSTRMTNSDNTIVVPSTSSTVQSTSEQRHIATDIIAINRQLENVDRGTNGSVIHGYPDTRQHESIQGPPDEIPAENETTNSAQIPNQVGGLSDNDETNFGNDRQPPLHLISLFENPVRTTNTTAHYYCSSNSILSSSNSNSATQTSDSTGMETSDGIENCETGSSQQRPLRMTLTNSLTSEDVQNNSYQSSDRWATRTLRPRNAVDLNLGQPFCQPMSQQMREAGSRTVGDSGSNEHNQDVLPNVYIYDPRLVTRNGPQTQDQFGAHHNPFAFVQHGVGINGTSIWPLPSALNPPDYDQLSSLRSSASQNGRPPLPRGPPPPYTEGSGIPPPTYDEAVFDGLSGEDLNAEDFTTSPNQLSMLQAHSTTNINTSSHERRHLQDSSLTQTRGLTSYSMNTNLQPNTTAPQSNGAHLSNIQLPLWGFQDSMSFRTPTGIYRQFSETDSIHNLPEDVIEQLESVLRLNSSYSHTSSPTDTLTSTESSALTDQALQTDLHSHSRENLTSNSRPMSGSNHALNSRSNSESMLSDNYTIGGSQMISSISTNFNERRNENRRQIHIENEDNANLTREELQMFHHELNIHLAELNNRSLEMNLRLANQNEEHTNILTNQNQENICSPANRNEVNMLTNVNQGNRRRSSNQSQGNVNRSAIQDHELPSTSNIPNRGLQSTTADSNSPRNIYPRPGIFNRPALMWNREVWSISPSRQSRANFTRTN